jgi:hypothetical protein
MRLFVKQITEYGGTCGAIKRRGIYEDRMNPFHGPPAM